MSEAYLAATLVQAYCRDKWPGNEAAQGNNMASTMFDSFARIFPVRSSGSHKYIDVDAINEHLGQPQGGGVFGYVTMNDGSQVLLTCKGPLAIIDGDGCRFLPDAA